jgi:hypothetical protein
VLTLDSEPVQLTQRVYDPANGVEHNHNDSDRYLIVLPYSSGGIRLERGRTVLHNGAVRPGTVRLVVPGERSTMAARSRFEAAVLSLPQAMLEDAAESLGEPRGPSVAVDTRADLRRLCPAIVSALGLHGRQRDLVVDGLATVLVGLILGAASASQPAGELHDDQYAAAVAYGETRLRSGIDLRDWAAAAGMAAPDFTRRFRRRTGTAPYAWFMDRRIDAAMHLLGTTDQPILDIARARLQQPKPLHRRVQTPDRSRTRAMARRVPSYDCTLSPARRPRRAGTPAPPARTLKLSIRRSCVLAAIAFVRVSARASRSLPRRSASPTRPSVLATAPSLHNRRASWRPMRRRGHHVLGIRNCSRR